MAFLAYPFAEGDRGASRYAISHFALERLIRERPGVKMDPRRTVLTTGDVAKICSVAPRTVSKWFDAGHLRGYRIPGSKDRRIPLEQLLRFMRAHGIPLNGLDGTATRILIIDGDAVLSDAIRSALTEENGFDVQAADSAFEAGAAAQQIRPHVLVVDVSMPDIVPKVIVRWVRSNADLSDTRLIGIANEITEGGGQALLQLGFSGYLSKPFTARALLEIIEGAMSPAET